MLILQKMLHKSTLFLLLAIIFDKVASTNSSRQAGQSPTVHSYCGQSLAHSRVRRVIGGEQAIAHAWPWQVLILNGTSVSCGGSIISPTWLLTSAHCMDRTYNRSIYVGRHVVNKTDEHGQRVEVANFTIHSQYVRGTATNPGDYDMALVKLKHPIKFSPLVHAVCLPDKATHFETGHECFLSGYGVTNTNTSKKANVLRQVRLPLVSQKVCNSDESYGGKIHQRYFCAGLREGGKDGCFADSGGPFVCAHDSGPWFLIGVMTWGEGCAMPNKYGVYLNVTEMMPIIREKVEDLPQPYGPTKAGVTTSDKNNDTAGDKHKERLFIAIICALCVIIVILLTTLCIVHFYTKGYICCTATEMARHQAKSPRLMATNGQLNKEIGV